VLAKHTAWQHTYDNFYSTKWVTYGGNLVGGDTPLYKHITKEIEEAKTYAKFIPLIHIYKTVHDRSPF
jgi:hypothetical protein